MALPTTIDYNKKEVFYETTTNSLIGNTAVHFIFPPLDTYNNEGEVKEAYVNRPDDRVVSADIAFLKLKHFEDANQASTTYATGDYAQTNVAGAFFAVEKEDYCYLHNNIDAPLSLATLYLERGTSVPIVAEAIKLPPNSNGGTFENKSLGMITPNVGRFNDVEVEGLNEGEKPTGQLMTAIRLEDTEIEDVTFRCFDGSPITNPRTSITNASSLTALSHYSGIATEFIDENTNEYVCDKTDVADGSFVDSSSYVSAVEIVNIERPLDDLRYGDDEDDLPFIFTGASHYFTDAELTTTGGSGVQGGSSVPIDIDVWGGDCFIGLHTFKISDSAYSLTDPEKDTDGTGTAAAIADQTEKWEYYFNKNVGSIYEGYVTQDMSRPYPLDGVSQTVTVLLESEVNPEFIERPQHNVYDYDIDDVGGIATDNLPLPVVGEAGQIRSKFKYFFSPDYIKKNEQKIFFPYQSFDRNLSEFGARIMYSDQKVYNTDIEGFDRFRVLNFYDMDESNGSISKLIEGGDNIYSIQENSFSYIPINAQTIQTADGGNISTRSGEIIGFPKKIDTSYGTQHPATVAKDGSTIFFVDQLRGEVCMFDGQGVKLISRIGMEPFFSTALSADPEMSVFYDNKRKEYAIFFRGSDAALFNAQKGVWTARLPETADVTTYGGCRVGDTMLLIGTTPSDTMWAGRLYSPSADVGKWWGQTFTPTIKFYVNAEPEIVKTFDGFTIVSDRIVDPQSFVVVESDGTLSTADLSAAVINDKEGTFRLKNLRDAENKRSRGVYGELEMDFITSAQSGVTSILTKYRPSFKPL